MIIDAHAHLWKKQNGISEADKQKFLGGNAVQFYNFKNLRALTKIKNMVEY